ncbi:hypothetical protein [Caballeronia sp. SL2Y3]|uniref:hypothetical protein n=1 Tax=Caballeronia sp. SL2Y3 TaxID=2878151 RepID=UPI001FD62669|nr:hypothetical protein [Caballeronia sp. SL2Y3]
MFVAALLLCPVGVAALFAFALYAEKVFRRGSSQKAPAPVRSETRRRDSHCD